jgi:hypothetical protein
MTPEDREKLASILFRAYEGPGGAFTWEEFKRDYDALAQRWLEVADAAVASIVVVKINDVN